MKARQLFLRKSTVDLKFGGEITIYMDCYQINPLDKGFNRAYTFSWKAYDPKLPERRVLMDQLRGRPCHLHIEDREVVGNMKFDTLEEAASVFWSEAE